MTFHLLIVDDEAPIRKGLSNFIPWDSFSCVVDATACDGLDAMEKLELYPIDIIITDIKMPVADGLELAKYAADKHPAVKVIILTGYADFSYAQTAIKYNVSDFLLKPTSKEKLILAVQSAQKQIADSRKITSSAETEMAFLKDQLLQELTDTPINQALSDKLEQCRIILHDYYIAAFQLLPFTNEITQLKHIIINQKHNSYCYRYNNLILVIYFVDCGQDSLPSAILENCVEIISMVETLESMELSIGISQYHNAPSQFQTAASEAITALTLNFYSEKNIALFTANALPSEKALTAESSLDLYQLETHLNNWCFADASSVTGSIFTKLKSHFADAQYVKNICSQIFYICSRVLMKRGSAPPTADYLSKISDSSDIFALERLMQELITYAEENLVHAGIKHNKIVESTIQYIRDNLAKPLSLELIADSIHINASHLSRTFKKECEESLTEYINKAKIERAKELLLGSDILTYEISELVGYNDPAYFSSIFKKYTGLSPTDFKQQYQKLS